MNKFTFHILGLPHTVTNKEYTACAYTQKVLKFGKMMTQRGHEVIHYGHEESDLICSEHVTVTTNKDLKIAYGNYDWRKNFFKFDINDHAYQTFYKNAIKEITKRKNKHDFILPFWGSGVRPVCDAHPDLICVEPGIGYAGGHWARWKIFESYAIYHAYCGLNGVGFCNQDWYDIVIANYFDPENFEYCEEKEDYFLYLGRVFDGKGVNIAIQTCEKIGARLIVAGQKEKNYQLPDFVEYVGYADMETRKKLMSKAKGSFLPSMYVEPFGGVQIENLFSGTPTITTDWGSFTENNINGVTGYRCRTFADFVNAAKNIDKIKPSDCRKFAENFSLDNIAPKYEKYFQDVLNVYTANGWYELKKNYNFLEKIIVNLPKNTNFLIIGAMDGITHDDMSPYIRKNSHWSGIFVEPIKDQFNKLKQNFKNYTNFKFENCAIMNEPGIKEIKTIPIKYVGQEVPIWADGISTFKENSLIDNFKEFLIKESVNCMTFKNLKEKYNIKNIDLLQIDCEGGDYDIFKQIWDEGFRPKIIKIEIIHMFIDDLNKLEKTLLEAEYKIVKINDDILAFLES